jgi:hypothetical protein
MKALVCEMCGSGDLVKQEGVFVCQNCGTKYSVEEARKMMVEGTVKVDNTEKLANLYQVARRARDNSDSEGAAKYYDLIQLEDPTSWEASFYSTYYKAMSCKIGEIRSAAISVSNCLDTVLGLVRDHVADQNEQHAVVEEIVRRCRVIAAMLRDAAAKHYEEIGDSIRHEYTQEYADMAGAARDILYTCGNAVTETFGDGPAYAPLAAKCWEDAVEMHREMLGYYADRAGHQKYIDRYWKKIEQIDPAYIAGKEKAREKTQQIQKLRGELNLAKIHLEGALKDATWSKGAAVIAAILVLAGIVLFALPDDTMHLPAFLVGIGGVLLFLYAMPKKKAKNLKEAEETKEKIARLEQELAELQR